MKPIAKKIMAGVLTASMLFAVPGISSMAASDSGDVIELTYWYSWGGSVQTANETLVEEFNETTGAELGIHVTAEYQGSYSETTSKLQAAAVAGEMPEVAVVGTTAMGIFLENGLLESLNDYVEDDLDTEDFFAGLLENTVVDGVWYGVPYLCSTPIMYLNVTLLEEAGLDPSGPSTWEEMAEYCRTVKEKTGAYGLSTYSYEWFMEAFMLEHGITMLNEDETATNFNSDEVKEILTYFKELLDEDCIRWDTSGDEGSSQVSADYTNQNCAMWFASTSGLSTVLSIAEENGFELNTCFIPAAESYGVPIGGCSLVMFSTVPDEKKDAVWEFIKFMTGTEQTAYASATTGYVPLRASAEEDESLQELYAEYPQYKVALDQLKDYSTGRPLNSNYVECSTVIMNALDDIMINDADMDTTLEEAEAKINQLLNQ